ncbi:MAG TPA: polysaccharide deacetylase family protein [Chloroflexota bacterium]|nr:polysaccharide deacetylase family protein [Chloroflexota bacterium]
MGLLSRVLPAVVLISLVAYLFLGVMPSREGDPFRAASVLPGASIAHPSSPTVPAAIMGHPGAASRLPAPTSAGLAGSAGLSLPLAVVPQAALPGNPQRPPGLARLTAQRTPSFLRLPHILPNRTIRAPILMYHFVSSLPAATDLNYGLTVTDADFIAQLSYLRAHGYHTVSVLQVYNALYRHAALPANPVMLTFDDGYVDNYTDAFPILRRFHDHAEFNIISAYVGLTVGINSYMTWPQLKQLAAAGMDIGSHTVDHQDLGTLSVDQIRFELRDSRNMLQRELHVPVQWLAYPSGEPFRDGSLAAQQLLLSLLPEYGYVGALLDGPLTTGTQSAQTPFQLERIRVAGGEDLADFAASLSS